MYSAYGLNATLALTQYSSRSWWASNQTIHNIRSRCSVINLAKLVQRQLATGERHGDPATHGGAAEIEVPEGSRRGAVSGQAQAKQFPACVQIPQPQGSI